MTSDAVFAAFHATAFGESVTPPVLQGIDIKATLHGPLLDVLVEQRFLNAGRDDIEVVYTFPLPARAQVAGLEFVLGGVRYSGAIRSKEVAAQQYEDAIDKGDTPVLVERSAEGLFTANLGNLRAGEGALVKIRYVQRVLGEGDAWRVAIPTVIAPRYGDPERDGGIAPHAAPVHSMFVDYDLGFELLIANRVDTTSVRCTSHATEVATVPTGITVTLRPGAKLDRDIVVWVQDAERLIAIAGPDLVTADGEAIVAMAALRLPIDEKQGGVAPHRRLSLRVVLDCSGSMQGDSINWATVACQRLIAKLHDDDEFSITRFGTDHEHWRPRLVPGNAKGRLEATDWLYDVQADLGGTEMQKALEAASSLAGDARRSDILLITDGQIEAADVLIAEARKAGHRVFIIGVGAAPNDPFLRDLADATEGRCQIVTPGESLPNAIDPIVTRIRAPTVEEVTVEWPQVPIWKLQWPQQPLPGETVYFFAGFERSVSGTLRARWPWGENHLEAHSPISEAGERGDALRSVAAGERLRSGLFSDPAKSAEDYQLVTQWTSLIAIAQREADQKAMSMPRLAKVEQMIPAGWGGTGTIKSLDCYFISASPGNYSDEDFNYLAEADVYVAYGRPEQAEEILKEALRLDPNLAGASEKLQEIRDLLVARGTPTTEESKIDQPLPIPTPLTRRERIDEELEILRPSLERPLERIKRRHFANSISNPSITGAKVLDGIALLRWAGISDKLLQAFASEGAESIDAEVLVKQLLELLEAIIERRYWDFSAAATGDVLPALCRGFETYLDSLISQEN